MFHIKTEQFFVCMGNEVIANIVTLPAQCKNCTWCHLPQASKKFSLKKWGHLAIPEASRLGDFHCMQVMQVFQKNALCARAKRIARGSHSLLNCCALVSMTSEERIMDNTKHTKQTRFHLLFL